MVDRLRQVLEESLQRGRVGGVEGGGARARRVERGLLEALGIAAGEDDVGALGARAPGGLEPDPGAAADDDDGLPEQLRLALVAVGIRSPHDAARWRRDLAASAFSAAT